MVQVYKNDGSFGDIFASLLDAIKAFFAKLFNKSSDTPEIDAPEIKLPC